MFSNKSNWILTGVSLKSVPDSKLALFQNNVWRQAGDKPLSELELAYFGVKCMNYSASMGLASHSHQVNHIFKPQIYHVKLYSKEALGDKDSMKLVMISYFLIVYKWV